MLFIFKVPFITRFGLDIRPERKFKSVVLPDPEGPRIAVKVEGETIPFKEFKIIFSSKTLKNAFYTILF